jgi:hypothetical protein
MAVLSASEDKPLVEKVTIEEWILENYLHRPPAMEGIIEISSPSVTSVSWPSR